MFLALALQTLLTIQKLVAAQPIGEVTSQAILLGGQSIRAFYDGYLMIIHPSHRNYIRVYSPEGQLLFEKDIQPGIALSVSSMAVDTDGTVAVSWGGFEQDGRRCAGISLLDRNGT